MAWPPHLGGNPGANLRSISRRCHLFEVALVWELVKKPSICPWVAASAAHENGALRRCVGVSLAPGTNRCHPATLRQKPWTRSRIYLKSRDTTRDKMRPAKAQLLSGRRKLPPPESCRHQPSEMDQVPSVALSNSSWKTCKI